MQGPQRAAMSLSERLVKKGQGLVTVGRESIKGVPAVIKRRIENLGSKDSSPEALLAEVERRMDFLDGHDRKKMAATLFLGSASGICGFAFAFLIGLMTYMKEHKEFSSGNGYFASTIAEMTHDPSDPSGKVFFCFIFLSGLLTFYSWYPWELRNVFTGDDETVCGVSWPMLRQFLVAPGLILMTTITIVPWEQMNLLDEYCFALHYLGWVMAVGGYVATEFHILWASAPGVTNRGTPAKVDHKELKLRWLVWGNIIFCICLFVVFKGILESLRKFGDSSKGVYADVWVHPNDNPHKVVLEDTASGIYFYLKIACYMSESGIGLSIMWSQMVVWYFCKERLVDLVDKPQENA